MQKSSVILEILAMWVMSLILVISEMCIILVTQLDNISNMGNFSNVGMMQKSSVIFVISAMLVISVILVI